MIFNIFDTSIGEVLIGSNEGILGIFGKIGALSSEFERDANENVYTILIKTMVC